MLLASGDWCVGLGSNSVLKRTASSRRLPWFVRKMKKYQRYTVTVLRLPEALRSSDQIETDAMNGISSIPGVTEVQIEAAREKSVTLSYVWSGSEQFQTTDEHLRHFGLRKHWKDEAK